MATIQFMPDRLNAEPVVFRGFTTPELGLTALFSTLAGIVISLPFLFFSWVMIPTIALILPLLVIVFGGKVLARIKRGKPENYLYRRLVVVKFFWTRRSDGRVMHRRATGRQGWPAFRTVRVIGSQVLNAIGYCYKS
ncbi:TIGR03750 family conjugal transfer protein [Klebsiella pneumoniae subsp. pneumoniae]|uniref:TIGR03750 family conjugal transfer protein n=4 Tax=Klebsiella pneumoniae TaxID=573 RepID=UPI00351543BC